MINENNYEYGYADKAEKSLKELNNWIFGISIGFTALIITQLKEVIIESLWIHVTYKIILGISMLNTLFVGFTKYLIMIRETKLGIYEGTIHKLKLEKRDIHEVSEKLKLEFDTIKCHGKLLNWTIVSTIIVVLITGIFILVIA